MAVEAGWRRVLAAAALGLSALGAEAQTAAATVASTPVAALPIACCVACHGPNGNSQVAETPSIAGQPRLFIENQLVIMREGLRDVPAMKPHVERLTVEQIGALARHFAAQIAVPMPLTVRPAQRLRGAELSRRALCGTCHLADYTGQNQVPRLAGQNEAYLRYALKQFRDHPGPGRDTIMAATLYGMNDGDQADLAHYFASNRP